MKSDNFKKLKQIVEKTHEKLDKEVIVKRGDGYSVYSEYNIVQNGLKWEVSTAYTDDIKAFGLSKSALAWCLAYKAERYNLASHIHVLDNRLEAKQADIDVITYHLKNPFLDPEIREIMLCRLSEDVYNRQSYKQQLTKCINSAKYIKIKGSSNNELKRFTKAN